MLRSASSSPRSSRRHTRYESASAALFVVGAGVAPRDEVEAALERLDASKVVGVVLNRCASSEIPYAGAYGYGKS